MKRHPLDLISAALGLIVIVLAVAVMLRRAPDLVTGGAWWLALAALLIGLALIPWRRSIRPRAGGSDHVL